MGLLVGFVLPYTLVLNKRVQDRFNDLVFAVPTKVYARPLPLAVGQPMKPAALELELTFAGYSHDDSGKVAGSWTKQGRSEEHTSELQSLMRISYAVFCLKKKKNQN